MNRARSRSAVPQCVAPLFTWIILAAVTAYGEEAKPGEDADWKKRFHEVYRLEEGETVKFVPAPFIPERANYLGRHVKDPVKFGGQFTFAWDETKRGDARLVYHSLASAPGKIIGGFANCGELPATEYEYHGDVKARDAALHGDWIFRKSASRDDRMKAVENVIRARVKVPVRAEKKKEQREVLVVTGKLEHKKMRGTRNHDSIHVYTDKLDSEEGADGGRGQLHELLTLVGEYARHRVIDETESSRVNIAFTLHHSAAEHRGNAAWLDQMLKNLQDQTGLKFKFEQRAVELWVIRVGKDQDAKDPPKDGL
jgi:hypothetical protein